MHTERNEAVLETGGMTAPEIVNRATRRRLKRALKLGYTPSAELAGEYLAKMERERAVEPVKVRLPRAFAGVENGLRLIPDHAESHASL